MSDQAKPEQKVQENQEEREAIRKMVEGVCRGHICLGSTQVKFPDTGNDYSVSWEAVTGDEADCYHVYVVIVFKTDGSSEWNRENDMEFDVHGKEGEDDNEAISEEE